MRFELGEKQGRFVFNTHLPGNRKLGHEFGTQWTPQQKRDLVEFLQGP